MSWEAIVGALVSGGLTGGATSWLAKAYITKSLDKLEVLAEKIGGIKIELAAMGGIMRQIEDDHRLVMKHERQLAVLESEPRRTMKLKS